VGAIGSHHVLATTYFAGAAGMSVEAVLVPQPNNEHVDEVRRAAIALGVRAFSVRSWAAAFPILLWRIAAGAHFVTVGGSSVLGSSAYAVAARELAAQVRARELPEPDVCVVAVGSGGTAAGLAAGFEAEGLRTRVIGVCVSEPPWAVRILSLWLACACARWLGAPRPLRLPMRKRLVLDARFLGAGYGHSTPEGTAATEVAQGVGLTLDPTYTAKAFACALWHVRARAASVILYWHTLSSAPMEPLLRGRVKAVDRLG
jgi:D-cysteine desulfhydrase